MIVIKAPASSANLGPGFDCLGLALGLYLYADCEESDLSPKCFQKALSDNLALFAYAKMSEALGLTPKPIKLSLRSQIPIARGLGSSAACIAAGAAAAFAMNQIPLDKEALFQLCSQMEGHPDNAAAAVFGGLCAAMSDGQTHYHIPLPLHPEYRFAALIPDFPLSTHEARQALPKLIPHGDAAYALSHAVFLVKALESGDLRLFKTALRDQLHEPFRYPLIEGGLALRDTALQLGAEGVCISGSGSTLLCVYKDPDYPLSLQNALPSKGGWLLKALSPDLSGVQTIDQ